MVQRALMLPAFLVPETVVEEAGASAAVAVEGANGLLLFTLGVLEVVEQETLLLGIYGSVDGESWDQHPAVEFPEKFYTGVSAVLLDLAEHSGLRFVRAQWKLNRWGRGDKKPWFRFYLFVEAA
jgi:hypothetical protein